MKNRKHKFYTADWHIGHENVMKFDNRPFRDMDSMCEKLILDFNKDVPDDGITFFGGDMGYGDKLKYVVSKLNGTKVAIMGNHDKSEQFLYSCGFDVVVHGITFYVHGQRVTMSHCPLLETFREDTSKMHGPKNPYWHGHNRELHRKFATPNDGQFHAHGHVHSPNDGQSKTILKRQFDVGLPGNNYRVRPFSHLESWVMKTLKDEKHIND